ncbi:hypothetical protein E4S40_16105 [Algoriphagus kandeliae]|uniref:Septum formation inhibitor Maf n=1 Tax=Algoriphagus kandeliae TaxID=2562278 RepID=A0A4Y9QN34_9BACT|nr:hypothetical protein [Algoriphagus kandeliae]TFV92366.1 hypothetical protein E4S40_16105 [Algoriphagus kandeliae]
MRSTHFVLSAFLLSVLLTSCGPNTRESIDEERFGAYWYQGKAEINVFDLKQSRYGEEREGTSVMIFVTEDFSRRKQVKLDKPESAGGDARKVLKLNMTRDFVTGIYPYHTMLSVFTPVKDEVPSFKITHSVSEWCGQTFAQLNWKNAAYQAKLYSYFESEGDQELKVDAPSEDEIFNLIRLSPELVPQGDVRLIPSLTFQRFAHIPFKAYRAKISFEELGQQTSQFVVEYPELNRTLLIQFIKTFPYEIVSWEEVRISPSGREERSIATRKEKMLVDYWTKNGVEDEWLRKQLGL